MKVALIVALAKNHTIGCNNQLPWHLPEDLAHFKSVTMGKPIIMGRKTFDSIGRPLPGRINIVITRQANYRPQGVYPVTGLREALKLAENVLAERGWPSVEEVMIIGGEQIYRQALPLADRLYLTRVDAEIEGDAFFPPIEPEQWCEVECSYPEVPSDPPYSFHTLVRVGKDQPK